MLKKMLKNERGLTLIELLAVVVILGIIAAIAVPAIGGIIDKSKQDAAEADAVQVLTAAKLYIASNPIKSAETITQSSTVSDTKLKDYMENGPTAYSITITPPTSTNKNYTYTAISATKNGKTATAATEAALLDN